MLFVIVLKYFREIKVNNFLAYAGSVIFCLLNFICPSWLKSTTNKTFVSLDPFFPCCLIVFFLFVVFLLLVMFVKPCFEWISAEKKTYWKSNTILDKKNFCKMKEKQKQHTEWCGTVKPEKLIHIFCENLILLFNMQINTQSTLLAKFWKVKTRSWKHFKA